MGDQESPNQKMKTLHFEQTWFFLVKLRFWTSAQPDAQGLGAAGRVWKRKDRAAMAPARPLSGGPVLGYVAAAVWEGSAPCIQQAQEDRALGVLLGENAAKSICGKKLAPHRTFPPH